MNSKDHKLIYKEIQKFRLIDGWLTIPEAIELYSLASKLPKNRNVVVCEIGTWKGKSTYVLSQALKNHTSAKIYCIDPFNGDGDMVSKEIYNSLINKGVPLLEQFKQNLEKFNYGENVEILKGYSWDIIKNFNQEIDLLFIDGNHDYDSVMRDYRDWHNLVKANGYIVFHDVGAPHTIGPQKVVENNILNNSKWAENKLVDTLFWAMKS